LYRYGRSGGLVGTTVFGFGALVSRSEQTHKWYVLAAASLFWAAYSHIKLLLPDYSNPQEVEEYEQLCRYGPAFHVSKMQTVVQLLR
jgi:hypothetical protein